MQLANGGTVPRFSKYSGVAEWSNCMFLWVNIGGKVRNEFENIFSDHGASISWFGGSRMTPESDALRRLLQLGRPPTLSRCSDSNNGNGDNDGGNDGSVYLFVREENCGYCCLGVVHAIGVDLTRHPVCVQWRLADYEQFKDKPHFRHLVSVANSG